MREATGELNMTVIVIVAVSAIAALFYAVIWPAIKSNLEQSTKCSAAICPACSGNDKTANCQYYDADANSGAGEYKAITCPCETK